MKKSYDVVVAIIKKNNKFLCCKRNETGDFPNKWEFPGGKIELFETKEEALKREIKEELQCDIIINKFLFEVEYEYKVFFVTLHIYLCSILEAEPTLVVHNDLRWCTKNELRELNFLDSVYEYLDQIIIL